MTPFRRPSNNSNGNSFDFQGRQLSTEDLNRRVVRWEHDGTLTVFADSFDGKSLNSPNDLVPHPDGSIWFTNRARPHAHMGTHRLTCVSCSDIARRRIGIARCRVHHDEVAPLGHVCTHETAGFLQRGPHLGRSPHVDAHFRHRPGWLKETMLLAKRRPEPGDGDRQAARILGSHPRRTNGYRRHLYGINFKNMPELEMQFGYYTVIVEIFALCGIPYWRRKNGWL